MDIIAAFFKEPLKTIQRSRILNFGTKREAGDVSIFDRRGAIHIGADEKGISDAGGGYTPNDPVAIYRPTGGNGIDLSKAMGSNIGWVYACVKAISDEMAGVRFTLFKVGKDGEQVEIEAHELLDLLDGVNEWQTGPEFKKMMSAHLELTGNAFIYLLGKSGGVSTDTEKPVAMYLLNPGSTKPLVDKTIFPYKITGYVMRDENREFRFATHQIIHVKTPDPNNPIMGKGTVDGIAEWIDNDNLAMEFNRNFFRNGARLSGVFETEMQSPEQAQRLKISFDEQYAGVKNAHKTIIMPKGVKFSATQASVKDMDFGTLLGLTSDRIRAGFRVSNTILGASESETNRATAETADYVFSKRVIKPKMEMIVSFLNEFLVPRFGDNLCLGFDDPVPTDTAAMMAEVKVAVAGKQIITQNEARVDYMGLEPVDDEGADELSSAMAPTDPYAAVGDKSKGIKAKRRETPSKRLAKVRVANPGKKKAVKTQFARNVEMRKGVAESLASAIAKTINDIKSTKTIVEMSDEEYITVYYVHQKSRIDDFKVKVEDALKKITKKQEREVVRNLPDAIKSYKLLPKKKEIVPSKLFDLKEWIAITVDALTPLFKEFYGKEAESATRNIGATPFDIFSDPSAKKALEHRIDLLSRSYNTTIRDALETKLSEGLGEGMSLAELTDRVSDIYAWSETYQAERVAKTESVAVSNLANKEAWKAAGTVKTIKWYTTEKDNVCEDCRRENGKVIDIDDNFYDKGDKISDNLYADYSAIGGPPLHPNCGCFIRPASFTPLADM